MSSTRPASPPAEAVAAETSPEWWLIEQLAAGEAPTVFLTPEPRPRISRKTGLWLMRVRDGLRARALEWTRLAIEIGEALRGADIAYAHTKGVATQFELYPEVGVRAFNDIDFMVRIEQLDDVERLMRERGFEYGEFDPFLLRIVEPPREERLLFRLNPDHLPHLSKPLPDPGVPYVGVDFATSLTWTAAPWQVAMEDVFATRVELSSPQRGIPIGESFPVLRSDYSFLFLALHVFRDAWSGLEAGELDLTLSQFGELARFRRADEDVARRAAALVAEHGLVEPMAWASCQVSPWSAERQNPTPLEPSAPGATE